MTCGSDLTDYRRFLVNHEFGHALGKHDADCRGPGRLAPMTMQQTRGLSAGRRNYQRRDQTPGTCSVGKSRR